MNNSYWWIFKKKDIRDCGWKKWTNTNQFVNNQIKTDEPTLFERTLETLGIKHKRTRPYSPWQNGKVKGNHKIDGKRFYSKQEFKSVENKSKKI